MPRISSFYGIVIAMYYRETASAFPRELLGRQGQPRDRHAGDPRRVLPDRAVRLVREWAELHRDELQANRRRARASEPLEPIAPLP
jgi:hypothetical protein